MIQSETIRDAMMQSPLMFILADGEGRVIGVNSAFEKLTGYAESELIGEKPHILLDTEAEEGLGDKILARLARGEHWGGRITNVRKDGTRYQIGADLWPIRDGAGTVLALACISRDITSELNLDAQRRTSQKLEAIGQLASGIAHEINTPTQYIGDNLRFFSESLDDLNTLFEALDELVAASEHVAEFAPQREAIAKVKKQIDFDYLMGEMPLAVTQSLEGNSRVADIVRAMKEFAHPGSDAFEPVDVNHAIANTLSVSRSEWKYVADVETDLAGDLPPVLCDPSAFSQVLLNLCVNAAHAMVERNDSTARGKLHIQTRNGVGTIEIRIRDTGVGIPVAIRERIFDPFFTTKDIGKGTGQGLALVHSIIVEKMRGTIEVDSELGVGTTFVLRIPTDTEHEARTPVQANI